MLANRTWVLIVQNGVSGERSGREIEPILLKFDMPEQMKHRHRILNNEPEDAAFFWNNYLDVVHTAHVDNILSSVCFSEEELHNIPYHAKYFKVHNYDQCTLENYKKQRLFGY